MNNVVSVQFRLGQVIPEEISDNTFKFYKWLAEKVSGQSCNIAPLSPRNYFPISNRSIRNPTNILYSGFLLQFKKNIDKANIFIVDINSSPGVFRGHLSLDLSQAIKSAISEITRSKIRCCFILILPELPSTEEQLYKDLSRYIKSGVVTIFSYTGNYLISPHNSIRISTYQYLLHYTMSRGDPYELLRKKMICRLGHFKRDENNNQSCIRYFYDGRYCEKEIVYLLENKIRNLFKNPSKLSLYYYCPLSSKWMTHPILAVANKMNFVAYDLNHKNDINVSEICTNLNLLVVDFVATGLTLRHNLKKLSKIIKNINNLKIISILTTKPTHPGNKIRVFNDGRNKYEINYFMEVAYRQYPSGECVQCKSDIPPSDPFSEAYYMLSTYDHWAISKEIGLKTPEEDTPYYRPPIERVINYPEMIEQYGAWFSKKFNEIVFQYGKGAPADTIIVCPEGEVGSQNFSEYLKMLLNVTVIRIPRNIIDLSININSDEYKSHINKVKNDEWYQLLMETAQYEVIVMDEFNASGRTFIGMKNIVTELGKNVRCYFSLNDLNPKWSESQHLPVYSLYSWQSI